MNCVSHINHGLWTHPLDRSASYSSLEYWANLARTAERGKLDGIFLPDIVGVYDVYKDSPTTAIATDAQTPVNDPLLVVLVMAYFMAVLECREGDRRPYLLEHFGWLHSDLAASLALADQAVNTLGSAINRGYALTKDGRTKAASVV